MQERDGRLILYTMALFNAESAAESGVRYENISQSNRRMINFAQIFLESGYLGDNTTSVVIPLSAEKSVSIFTAKYDRRNPHEMHLGRYLQLVTTIYMDDFLWNQLSADQQTPIFTMMKILGEADFQEPVYTLEMAFTPLNPESGNPVPEIFLQPAAAESIPSL